MKTAFTDKKIKILIMDTPIGSGHVMAARAVKEEFIRCMPNAEIMHISTFDFLPNFLANTFVKLYLLSLKISPRIYAFFYKWGNKEKSTASRDKLNSILARLACDKIVKFNPDIAVATHATACGIIAQLKSDGYLDRCSLYGVVTDYIMHNWWYYQEVAAYFTADIPLDNISFADNQTVYKYGIPIKSAFSSQITLSRLEMKDKLKLGSSGKIYLLFGGGEGILPMQEIALSIKKLEPDANIVAICGRNAKLRQNLLAMNMNNLQVLGFIDNVEEYIYSADCVISKAGGISSTEILAQNANYIIYKPLMGQEMNNAVFLRKRFAVHIANNEHELMEIIAKMDDNNDYRGNLVPVNATKNIVRQIFDLTSKHNY